MFSNGRARSGVIVLPCGAGKTLTGIVAASYIKKSVLVLCNSGVSVEQWRKEFLRWSNIGNNKVPIRFTSKVKDKMFDPKEAGIVVSTYGMISYAGKRSEDKIDSFEKIRQVEWGLVILDEV